MKMPKQKKTNTREEKEIISNYFMDCRFRFQDQYKGKVKLIEKNFPLYAVDTRSERRSLPTMVLLLQDLRRCYALKKTFSHDPDECS